MSKIKAEQMIQLSHLFSFDTSRLCRAEFHF
jgi:hypothetical protein